MALLPRCGGPQYKSNGLFVEGAIYSACPLRHNAFGAGPTFVINTSPVPYGSDALEVIPRADVVDLAAITPPRSLENSLPRRVGTARSGHARQRREAGATPPRGGALQARAVRRDGRASAPDARGRTRSP